MYFLDLNGLIEHFKAKKNSQQDSFKYLLGVFALYTIPTEAFLGQKETEASIITAGAGLIGFAIGLLIAYMILQMYYRNNGGNSGEYFLDRFFGLAWVVGLRIGLASIPIYGAIIAAKQGASEQYGLLIVLGVFAIGIAIYGIVAINNGFKEISGN